MPFRLNKKEIEKIFLNELNKGTEFVNYFDK